jgi:hypothetical protein
VARTPTGNGTAAETMRDLTRQYRCNRLELQRKRSIVCLHKITKAQQDHQILPTLLAHPVAQLSRLAASLSNNTQPNARDPDNEH